VNVILTVIGIAFFAAIALLGYRLYMENRFTLDALPARDRAVLYISIAVAMLGFAGANRWACWCSSRCSPSRRTASSG